MSESVSVILQILLLRMIFNDPFLILVALTVASRVTIGTAFARRHVAHFLFTLPLMVIPCAYSRIPEARSKKIDAMNIAMAI